MEELMHLVEQEGIWLTYRDLSPAPRRLLGLYFFDPQTNVPFIVLDHSVERSLPLHRSVLAEELGHHFTVPQARFLAPYTSYSLSVALGRDEARALRWACDYLVPVPAFIGALSHGALTVDELAEQFTVTPWLIRRRLWFLNHDLSSELWLPARPLAARFADRIGIRAEALAGQLSLAIGHRQPARKGEGLSA